MSTQYSLQEITNKYLWEQLVSSYPEANFLQSWNWGVFHASLGKQVRRLAVYQDQEVVGIFTVVIEKAKRGRYVSVAGGPLLDWSNGDLTGFVISSLQDVAREEKCHFVRFRPQALDSVELREQLQTHGVRLAPMHLTADLTLQIDLTVTPEELLSQMRKNTRSTVRKSGNLGISTTISQDKENLKEFYELQCQLAKRQGFIPFSEEFLTKQFEAFVEDDQVALISAFHQNVLLAQAFVIFYNSEAVYHYGISTDANSNQLPGSYACQWAALLEAQNRGCTRYNMWGIAPETEKNHRFAGVSLFKRGFGGQEVPYLPAHDIPVSPFYYATWGFEQLRARRRRLH